MCHSEAKVSLEITQFSWIQDPPVSPSQTQELQVRPTMPSFLQLVDIAWWFSTFFLITSPGLVTIERNGLGQEQHWTSDTGNKKEQTVRELNSFWEKEKRNHLPVTTKNNGRNNM